MQRTMRAAVAHQGEGRLRIEDVPVPEIGPGEALVKVAVCGMPHGLMNLVQRGRIKLLPAPVGDEAAGVVAEVGPGVRHVRPGDRVRVHAVLSCRDCDLCRTDQEPFCPAVSLIGHAVLGGPAAMELYERYHGGCLAEYVRVPVWNLDPLPDSVPFEVAARVHNLAVCLRALRRAAPRVGDTLVVLGGSGASGAATVKCAPLFGVERVVIVARSRANLDRVRDLEPGLVEVVSLDELPVGWEEQRLLTERLRQLSHGRGVGAVVDFLPVASPATLQGIMALRRGGSAVLVGGGRPDPGIPYGMIMTNGLEIKGSYAHVRRDATDLLGLLGAGRMDVSALLTHSFPLEKANDAVTTVESRAGAPLWVNVEIDPDLSHRSPPDRS